MRRLNAGALCAFLVSVLMILSSCAGKENEVPVHFSTIGGYADRNGQANIVLVSYTGEAEKEDVSRYAKELGCGMIFAYYYPDSVARTTIPVSELDSAENYNAAHELLFMSAGVPRWSFATQCLGIIPTLSDCRKSSISTNCR